MLHNLFFNAKIMQTQWFRHFPTTQLKTKLIPEIYKM